MTRAEAEQIVQQVCAGDYAGPTPVVCATIPELQQHAQEACDQQHWGLAETYLRQLFDRGHALAQTAHHLGRVAMDDGRPQEAIRWFRICLEHDPARRDAHEYLIFLLDAQPSTSDAEAHAERRRYFAQHGRAAYDRRRPYDHDRDPDRPLRVGYVSGDFNFHSAGIAFTSTLFHHSAAVEPYFYCTLPAANQDRTTASWRQRGRFYDVASLTPAQLAAVIREDAIDILVDLAGYTQNNRLSTFAAKPAPIQLQAWGYVLGTASPAMDGILADAIVASPEIRAGLTERVIDLPCLLGFQPREDVPATTTPPPCLSGPPIFSVFQRAMKTNAETYAVWRRLLEHVPEARLVFKAPDYTPSVRGQIVDAFGPALRGRLSFEAQMGHRDHLLSYQDVDLALDPWPQTGGVSTLEALWMGVPTVTLCGDRMIQRASASILSNVGFIDCITFTADDYRCRAAALVTTDRDRLAEMRAMARTRLQTSPIMTGYVTAVETAYRALWREWCASQKAQAA